MFNVGRLTRLRWRFVFNEIRISSSDGQSGAAIRIAVPTVGICSLGGTF